ncbi:nucleoside diphosphatase-like protein [Thermochaetoides thermophila DSM 1495]|uniref:Nucleoside diphosphatase-like protein n=1 Tax=Chaetomium thermophilum (strain DSM 1495 / CBS 144.50 / IMI 039719) TaxID=759272 RepID=G0S627_CHATD|nr:nucleoside diphosphatase-like protein [Thermochaetoides thermophila DSM 1495]EGS21535.1 nucleoside diphosphatase-like protein [Thermochaetoides thermophila DSM 1495]
MATAGMRLLPQIQQAALTREVCSYLRQNTRFYIPDCSKHVQVIKGETEGLYGWIALNYLLGGFDHPEDHRHGKGHHTYGFLDMGGASAQIAFAPNATEAEKHANDLKLLRLRTLDGSSLEYKVFTATWLGFGVDRARESYIKTLEEYYEPFEGELPDPCLPRGLRITVDGNPATQSQPRKPTLLGTGVFDECLRRTYPLLGKDKPCQDHPCLLNGQHVPAIDFDVNHFIGVSEYWHTTHGVFGGKGDKAYDFATYQKRVKDYCGQDWETIKSKVDNRDEFEMKIAQEACFKASWLINVLYEGIGIPRVGIDQVHSANVSKGAVENVKEKGFADPFQPVDKIDGIEVSWTLGPMVLYASGQIPPKTYDDRFPVGFGSNEPGIPADFQFAGSTWQSSQSQYNNGTLVDTESDDWDLDADEIIDKAKSNSAAGFFMFVFFLLVFLYFFRRRDRRMRLYSRVNCFIRRTRRSGGSGLRSKGSHGHGGLSGLAHKVFGSATAQSMGSYERIMEEGEANRFELDGNGPFESSIDGYADTNDCGRVGRSSGLATPKDHLGRFDHLVSSPTVSALDRSGLVVRTDSRERLTLMPPPLGSSGVGRRSRAGSPTRLKSPLLSPLQEA